METQKFIMTVNKGGSGGVTYRSTLPVDWVRKMGLGEDNKNLKLEFNGESITITNNEEEVKMLNGLLEKAKIEIEGEIEKVGFIDDSDNYDRFLDELAKKLTEKEILKGNDDIDLYYEKEGEIEELSESLLEEIESYMKKTYKSKGSSNDRGDYTGCYYKYKEGLKKWNDYFIDLEG